MITLFAIVLIDAFANSSFSLALAFKFKKGLSFRLTPSIHSHNLTIFIHIIFDGFYNNRIIKKVNIIYCIKKHDF